MATACPKGIGRGGKKCKNCLKDVDLEKTPVFYSERPQDFALPKNVVKSQCGGK